KNSLNTLFTDGFSASCGVIACNFRSGSYAWPSARIFSHQQAAFPFPPLTGLSMHCSGLLVLLKIKETVFWVVGIRSAISFLAKEVDAPAISSERCCQALDC